jgi:hypothetical protein
LNCTRIVIGVVLLELNYSVGIKHSYRGHHYVLQNVLILKTVQVTYAMGHSSPFIRYPAPAVNRHNDHCVWR